LHLVGDVLELTAIYCEQQNKILNTLCGKIVFREVTSGGAELPLDFI
jgi:hypothetical protein